FGNAPHRRSKTGNFLHAPTFGGRNAPREADDHGVVVLRVRVPCHHRRLVSGPPRRIRAELCHGRTRHGNPSASHLPHHVRGRLRYDRGRVRHFPRDPE